MQAVLRGRIARMRAMGTPMSKIALIVYRSVMQNFRDEGRPSRWQRLKPATLLRRIKGKGNKYGPKILQDTGMLRQSISPYSDEKTATVGTSLPYARAHQLGAHVNKRQSKTREQTLFSHTYKKLGGGKFTIPARPFLAIQREDKIKILNIIRGWLYSSQPGSAE